MELIYEWLHNNQLIFNWNKTKAMYFSHYNRDQVDPFILPTNIFISIDGHDIEFVDEFRLLGVTVDNKITFDTHIANIISRVNSKTVLIIKNSKHFPTNSELRSSSYLLCQFLTTAPPRLYTWRIKLDAIKIKTALTGLSKSYYLLN